MTDRSTDIIEIEHQPPPSPFGALGALTVPPASVVPGFDFVSEREPGGWICCAACSAAMLKAWADGTDSSLRTAHAIRSGAGLPHKGGMTRTQVEEGMNAVGATGWTRVSPTRAGIDAALAAGYAIAAMHTFGDLPDALRHGLTFKGNHSATLAGRRGDGRWGWFDPQMPQGWQGEWVNPADIMAALWTDVDHTMMLRKDGGSMGDGAFVIYDPPKRGKVAPRTEFFGDWALTARRGAIGTSGGPVKVYGYRGPIYAIGVDSAQGWTDEIPRLTNVFVAKDAVTNVVDAPIVAPPAPGPTPTELGNLVKAARAERDADWREWVDRPAPDKEA